MTPARTLAMVLPLLLAGCYGLQDSDGGGEARVTGPRKIEPADVALPPGYRIEAIATHLTFPTGVAFDDRGRPHVVEAGYSYGEVFTQPRLLRIEPDGATTVVATGQSDFAPWNGVAFHNGAFYVAEGGVLHGGRISRIEPGTGKLTPLIANLPSMGDHHVNGPAIGPDGSIHFGLGTATNSGIVGADNHANGWLTRHPRFHDTPGADVTLAGVNYRSADPLSDQPDGTAITGAYLPFGVASMKGQVVRGQVLCSGSVVKIPADGGPPTLVAWGFRNPFGLAFAGDGALYVTDQGLDVRGSRPAWGAADLLWRVRPGLWHGWPDFHSGMPLDSDRFQAPGWARPQRVLADLPNDPPVAAAKLPVHSASCGLDFSRSESFGYAGQAFVAQFGDLAPRTGKVLEPVGFKVARVDPVSGVCTDFAVNRGRRNGPATLLGGGGLERPIAVRFDPQGQALYIVDFGILTTSDSKLEPRKGTGVLWRIVREGT